MESKCPKIRGSNCLKMGGSRCLKIGGSNCPKIGGSKCPKSKKPTAELLNDDSDGDDGCSVWWVTNS